jgi:signal transduction histidine kinase
MKDADIKQLTERYHEALRAFIADGDEGALNRGYEIGRRALADGCGVLELGTIHHQALRALLAQQPLSEELLLSAEKFLTECLSPFEMSHRGAQEGTRALRHLNEVLEGELKRIAHALHDEAGQLLASVHIALAALARDFPAPAQNRLDEIKGLLKQIELDLRNMSHELRPTVLDNLGLLPALEFLADKVARRTGLAVSVRGELPQRLSPAVETALYRIVQEALNNAARHAQASNIKIELRVAPGRLACTVRDDGQGFDVGREADTSGFGLIGIRERLNALGGSLHVRSKPRQGTTLLVEIPLGGSYALPRAVSR